MKKEKTISFESTLGATGIPCSICNKEFKVGDIINHGDLKLLKAAPDLLDALILANRIINSNTLLDAGNPVNIKIKAAIAKATP